MPGLRNLISGLGIRNIDFLPPEVALKDEKSRPGRAGDCKSRVQGVLLEYSKKLAMRMEDIEDVLISKIEAATLDFAQQIIIWSSQCHAVVSNTCAFCIGYDSPMVVKHLRSLSRSPRKNILHERKAHLL